MCRLLTLTLTATALVAVLAAPAAADDRKADKQAPTRITMTIVGEQPRPRGLAWLYATNAALGAADVALTVSNVRRGAIEANPLVANMAHEPVQLTVAKVGTTIVAISAAERLWKNGHRKAAIFTTVAAGVVNSWVVAHNMGVRRALK